MNKLKPLVLFAVAMIVAFSSASLLADNTADHSDQLVVVMYRVGDLPVWTNDGKFASDILMVYLQTKVSPRMWEARGGVATMASYPKNASLVISAPAKTHDEIIKTLRLHRGE
ncbi:hypothetical protein [Neorhodopirellula lusitana]|uniref:hypothetical protein n=1 Tax=Neorhodopirellula lusitana TaxID=445327 RepID=UPI00384B5177